MTIAEVLGQRARRHPDRLAFTFLAGGGAEASLTYAALDARAREVAGQLLAAARPGDRALLAMAGGLDYVAALFGCFYAGIIAVPVHPPRDSRHAARLAAISAEAQASLVLTTDAAGQIREAQGLAGASPGAAGVSPASQCNADFPGDVAFLQFTSGTTGTPRGVIVTHQSLIANSRMMHEAFQLTEDDVVVGWLPLFHDMGLIGNVLQTVYAGMRAVLMPPEVAVARPIRWLEAISRYRGTLSGGPNFAYDWCATRVDPARVADLDLGSWRVAFNGAEPIRAETLARFAQTFAPAGFRPRAFFPCYGLAEATLFVSGGPPEADPLVIERDGRPLVGCGRLWGGATVAIVDPANGAGCPPGEVGEIRVGGPAVAAGYWGRPEDSADAFGAAIDGADAGIGERFVRTGDLGFLAQGQLFVTGRIKDLVIVRGRNHYPQDIENTVKACDPAFGSCRAAAFGLDVGGSERLIVALELPRRGAAPAEPGMAPAEPGAIASRIRQAVWGEHDLAVHAVWLVEAGSLPVTSSGKLRRHECRSRFVAGGEGLVVAL